MGWYQEHVQPRVLNRACAAPRATRFRERVCADLSGTVVELGFGSGLNAPYYPAAVTTVFAIEPSDLAWRLAQPRVEEAAARVERAGLDAGSLELEDDSADFVLSTFAMCSIPDVQLSLGEVMRVLKPGGRLHFLEHGLAPPEHEKVRRWQRRLESVQGSVAGCRLRVDIQSEIERAGFEFDQLDRFFMGRPWPFTFSSLGTAVRAA